MLKGSKKSIRLALDEKANTLVRKPGQPKSLVRFFRESPLVGIELDLERTKDKDRNSDCGPACQKLDRPKWLLFLFMNSFLSV